MVSHITGFSFSYFIAIQFFHLILPVSVKYEPSMLISYEGFNTQISKGKIDVSIFVGT